MRTYLNPLNWSILLKISLGVLISSLLPVVLIAYLNFTSSVSALENSEYRNIESLATATANRLDQLVLDNKIAAAQLGSDAEIMALLSDPANAPKTVQDSVSASLSRILVSNPQYEYVYLVDKTGKVIISKQSASVTSLEGQDFSKRDYFLKAMEGKPYIDAFVGQANKKLGFYFSSPVLGKDGKPVGASVVKLKGEAITDIISQFKSGRTGFAFLVDQNGVIISHPNQDWQFSSLAPLPQNIEQETGQRYLLDNVNNLNLPTLADAIVNSNQSQHASYVAPADGSEQIIGIAKSSELNWSVIVNKAKSEFTAPLDILALRTILSVLFISAGAIAGGILLARYITQPLGKLSTFAMMIQKGDLPEPGELSSIMKQGDEVGKLATVFNDMLSSLAARVSELRALNIVSRKISSSFNVGTTLTLVLNSVRNVVPYDRALVMLYDPQTERFCTRAAGDGRGPYLNRIWSEEDTPAIRHKSDGNLQRLFNSRRDETIVALKPNLDQVDDYAMTYSAEWGDFEAHSYLGMPMWFKDELVGVIELASAKDDCFNANHSRVLELIAGQAAVALRNALDVEQREGELRRQIDALRIEVDESKKQKHVEEIVESDYFQALSSKADKIRQRREEEKLADNPNNNLPDKPSIF